MKIIIGASTFADEDKTPLRLLEAAGIEYQLNPLKRRWSEAETIGLSRRRRARRGS